MKAVLAHVGMIFFIAFFLVGAVVVTPGNMALGLLLAFCSGGSLVVYVLGT